MRRALAARVLPVRLDDSKNLGRCHRDADGDPNDPET
jgi:hypothetical protein